MGVCGGLFGGLQGSSSTPHITLEQKASHVLDQLHSRPKTEAGIEGMQGLVGVGP